MPPRISRRGACPLTHPLTKTQRTPVPAKEPPELGSRLAITESVLVLEYERSAMMTDRAMAAKVNHMGPKDIEPIFQFVIGAEIADLHERTLDCAEEEFLLLLVVQLVLIARRRRKEQDAQRSGLKIGFARQLTLRCRNAAYAPPRIDSDMVAPRGHQEFPRQVQYVAAQRRNHEPLSPSRRSWR